MSIKVMENNQSRDGESWNASESVWDGIEGLGSRQLSPNSMSFRCLVCFLPPKRCKGRFVV